MSEQTPQEKPTPLQTIAVAVIKHREDLQRRRQIHEATVARTHNDRSRSPEHFISKNSIEELDRVLAIFEHNLMMPMRELELVQD